MNASTVEAIAERMEIADAQLALYEDSLRHIRNIARGALMGVAAADRDPLKMAETLNAIATHVLTTQQHANVTEDAEHKRGHEKDDAELIAWHKLMDGNLEPATLLKYYAARKRQTLREHGEALLRLNAADPTLARANDDEDPIE